MRQQNEIAAKYKAGNYGYGHAKLELLAILLDYFSEAELTNILEAELTNSTDLQSLTESLVQKSLEKGSDDNVTVVASLILPSIENKAHILSSITRRITKLCS